MAKIFLSYSRRSEAIAKVVAEDIEVLGHDVWFDRELSGGHLWWNQILAMIREADVFVLVLDPAALDSSACRREYGYAADLGKPILPALVAEGVSTNLLPPALSAIQFVDYRHQERSAALRLAKALSAVPRAEPLPDPLPAAPEAPVSYLTSLTDLVEAPSELSYEQQVALVFDLKPGLRDPETTDDTRTLLAKLRRRRDLFATVADDIEELLTGSRMPPVGGIEPPTPDGVKVAPTAVRGWKRGALVGAAVGWLLLTILNPDFPAIGVFFGAPLGAMVGAVIAVIRRR